MPVNIVLDEMNNIGIIPDFSRRLSTIRSRALQVLMCCQNLPQIQNRYPNNLWAELVGNADTQLMLGCTDDVTAEYFSVRSGDMTVDGGIDCLCTYPKRGRPPRGCRVSVRILGINYESNRIWGVITHMSTVR